MRSICRGVPVELRLRIKIGEVCVSVPENFFTMETIRAFDSTLSTDEAFLAVRGALLARMDGDESKLLQLNTKVAHAALTVHLYYPEDDAATGVMFANCHDTMTAFSKTLGSYQRDNGALAAATSVATRHTLFDVETIQLGSGREFITGRVVESAEKLMAVGFPVDWFFLQLDLRFVDCSEDQLRRLVGAVAQRSRALCIDTIAESYEEIVHKTVYCIDENGEDHRERIWMMLRAVANVGERVSTLNVGGLLKLCDEDHNREAIWRGLFEDVLSPDWPLERLLFTDQAVLREEDTTWIDECASEWRVTHPDKKLRVKCLTLNVDQPSDAALGALLSAFDDIEEVSLSHSKYESPISRDLFGTLLTFPSLRKVHLVNATIPTMDLFDPTILDESRPGKLVLEELELDQIVLEDVASLERFFRNLNPLESTNPLTKTLRKLRVTQRDCDTLNPVDFYDNATMAALNDMLESNQVLRDVTVTDVGDKSMREHWGRLFRHDTCYLPAPLECRKTALAKARNAGFVSAIYATTSDCLSARSHLDPTLVRHVFDFSAPVVRREIHKLLIKRDDL